MHIPALPFCHLTLKGKKPVDPRYPRELKTIGDNLRKKRLDIKLKQSDVARIIGVSETSIYNWENNRTKPRLKYVQKILKFIEVDPKNLDK